MAGGQAASVCHALADEQFVKLQISRAYGDKERTKVCVWEVYGLKTDISYYGNIANALILVMSLFFVSLMTLFIYSLANKDRIAELHWIVCYRVWYVLQTHIKLFKVYKSHISLKRM